MGPSALTSSSGSPHLPAVSLLPFPRRRLPAILYPSSSVTRKPFSFLVLWLWSRRIGSGRCCRKGFRSNTVTSDEAVEEASRRLGLRTSRKFYQPSSLLILGARASQHPPCMFSDFPSQDCSLQTLSPLLHGNLGDYGPFATSLLAIFTTARTIRMWTHTGRTPPESRRVSGTPVHLQLGPYIHCAYDYSPTRLHQDTGVWYWKLRLSHAGLHRTCAGLRQ